MTSPGGNNNPLFLTLLLLMSSRGDLDVKLQEFSNMLQVTQETLRTLKSGVENFHTTLQRFSEMHGPRADHNPNNAEPRDNE